jgi:hypothetical protein
MKYDELKRDKALEKAIIRQIRRNREVKRKRKEKDAWEEEK